MFGLSVDLFSKSMVNDVGKCPGNHKSIIDVSSDHSNEDLP